MKKVTINFEFERETKNTLRFAEIVEGELETTKIGSIYVSKSTLKEMGWTKGKNLALTIECK